MSAFADGMRITIQDRSPELRERLRDRLDRAAQLLCAEHGQPVLAVSIHGRDNGWFESRWTTCCEVLEQAATAIVKNRC
jgi:hypothetical protein